MENLKEKKVLISGASIAGLSAAYWMNRLGYQVTVVELANGIRTAGAAINLNGNTIEIAKRMGIFEKLRLNRLQVEKIEFKNADDVTEGSITLVNEGDEISDDDLEIERDKFMHILFDELKNDVIFIFGDSITAINEIGNNIDVNFKSSFQQRFDLVLGCDGAHSLVRKIWFGPEQDYAHFLGAYFSITTVNKLLIKQKTMQMFNVPDKAIMLNAYKNKTDIIFCFFADEEISYDYRNSEQQRKIIMDQFAGQSWRTKELLQEVEQSPNFYFDKFCQIKMPCWTKGSVALIGDAGYCATAAAGMGASLAITGAAALADALQKYNGNIELAFQDYNQNLRPFIQNVQAKSEMNMKDNFIPRTEEAIRIRNAQTVLY